MSSIRYWVWLSSVSAANPRARFALAEHYGDAEKAFHAPTGELKTIQGLSAFEAEQFERRDLRETDRILEACRRENITILTLADAAYPQRLKNIYDPPVVLYLKGRLPDVDAIPSVAVIGTRSATPYGLKMGRDIAFEIAKCGGIVVSGLTEGVDRAAARGCLLAGGTCIGVLGTAHGRDGELREDVAATGALVSEYPPGTEPQRRYFRERNRIASGLSHAVCVVEAPEQSGALLFAREALEQGREIFAVPGNADAENSAGIMTLLKQGARPAASGWDVLEDFALIYPDKLRRPNGEKCQAPDPEPVPARAKSEKKAPAPKAESDRAPAASTKKEIDKEQGAGYIDLHEQLSKLSADQLQIVTAIGRGETHIDDIIEATGMSAAKVLSQLTILEIKGYIRRVAGRRVSLNITKQK
ncbi:MAG: DNA-protecting protein DprA [Oscillospiraceae bacterium]|nr:DNA-protecting protein DprA [Oscillospiraceae bacterium]